MKWNIYNQQMKEMPEPIMASELPKVKLDLHGIQEYARKKGVTIADLSKTEKVMFIDKDELENSISVLFKELNQAIDEVEEGKTQDVDDAWKEIDAI